jgi:hypothetical protein
MTAKRMAEWAEAKRRSSAKQQRSHPLTIFLLSAT